MLPPYVGEVCCERLFLKKLLQPLLLGTYLLF